MDGLVDGLVEPSAATNVSRRETELEEDQPWFIPMEAPLILWLIHSPFLSHDYHLFLKVAYDLLGILQVLPWLPCSLI